MNCQVEWNKAALFLRMDAGVPGNQKSRNFCLSKYYSNHQRCHARGAREIYLRLCVQDCLANHSLISSGCVMQSCKIYYRLIFSRDWINSICVLNVHVRFGLYEGDQTLLVVFL